MAKRDTFGVNGVEIAFGISTCLELKKDLYEARKIFNERHFGNNRTMQLEKAILSKFIVLTALIVEDNNDGGGSKSPIIEVKKPMKHLIIANPLGCPFRIKDTCPIDGCRGHSPCPALEFPSFCKLGLYGDMRHLVISNPRGCPFRLNEICSINERDWDDMAPDCPELRFATFCQLDEYDPNEKNQNKHDICK